MAIPKQDDITLPLLEVLADGRERDMVGVVEDLGKHFGLTAEEMSERLDSGEPRFKNRIWWSRTNLLHSGLITAVRRRHVQITAAGLELLASKPTRLDDRFLRQHYPGYAEFAKVKKNPKQPAKQREQPAPSLGSESPNEQLEAAAERLHAELRAELLRTIQTCSPDFFERLVVDVLVALGYGGNRQDAARAVGRSGDEGIDGTIKEDALGLDTVYIQAKRWQSNVGRPEIQLFAGALQGHKARKGVFITTSRFSKEAHEYVSKIDARIVLMNGEELADLMIAHKVGVTRTATYEICRMDGDYFQDD